MLCFAESSGASPLVLIIYVVLAGLFKLVSHLAKKRKEEARAVTASQPSTMRTASEAHSAPPMATILEAEEEEYGDDAMKELLTGGILLEDGSILMEDGTIRTVDEMAARTFEPEIQVPTPAPTVPPVNFEDADDEPAAAPLRTIVPLAQHPAGSNGHRAGGCPRIRLNRKSLRNGILVTEIIRRPRAYDI